MDIEFRQRVSVLRPRTEEEIVLLSFARIQDMPILPPIGSIVTFGNNGGSIVFEGTPEDLLNNKNSYTAQYLSL